MVTIKDQDFRFGLGTRYRPQRLGILGTEVEVMFGVDAVGTPDGPWASDWRVEAGRQARAGGTWKRVFVAIFFGAANVSLDDMSVFRNPHRCGWWSFSLDM